MYGYKIWKFESVHTCICTYTWIYVLTSIAQSSLWLDTLQVELELCGVCTHDFTSINRYFVSILAELHKTLY